MHVSPEQFRTVIGNFATGVTVVTLADDDPHGMTANAVSSVSLDPPLVLVCVDEDTTTYERLEEGDVDGFCLNILTSEQRPIAEHFAGMTELDPDPFEADDTTTAETGAVVFEDALAYLDCTRYSRHEAGDHVIYVGEVQRAEVLGGDAEPLTFYRGGWGTIAPEE